MIIRRAEISDAAAIAGIYNWYIANTIITFETEPVASEEMEARIIEKLKKHDWLVAEIANEIIGYAYYGAFRPRAAYGHTVEATIYLLPQYKGRGCGAQLYDELFRSAGERKFREVLAVIALPNPESIRFHEKAGFTHAGVMRNIGCKFSRYIDVAILQKSI
ncbi:MAG: N-acetyltransferase family protein [Bacteroidota bacterium]